ncbi:N,N-dimethylformamidase beta subunit family domain-containing protein [Chelativorans sp. Marseille-P2723]|uniref:N,N-dimethylformamidase beta subunit family domain-containing protein n=1 Tax=Chelativorans sp. Marseille-P2723 TaxID=2709133 RepID=UPI00156F3120|nr:N,N-dimethylformamidase beta subunit family domain-containing protein [Chelativorans sp. Marseille-P2723]
MERAVNHSAMAAVGYTTPWSVKAGEPVALHLSCGKPLRGVSVRRLDLPNPEAMGWPVEAADAALQHRTLKQGSYLRVSAEDLAKAGQISGLRFELLLTRNPGQRTIFEAGSLRLTMSDGVIALENGGSKLADGIEFPARTWLTLRLMQDDGYICLSVKGHDPLAPYNFQSRFADAAWRGLNGDLLFGADKGFSTPTLNARFAAITLETDNGAIGWSFPTLLPAGPISSTGPAKLFLEAVNQPTFCVTSVRWDGSSFDPRTVPSHYDAVHCHDDDMGPLDWPASHLVLVPDDAEAGVYAFVVEYEGGTEEIIFFVASHEVRAPILFLVPTATYLAYADEFLPAHLYEWKCEDRGQRFAVDNNLRSLYDYHSDFSGVSICSYRKPKATLRADYRYPLCGCPHNLPVDLHFLRFCRANNIAIDLITDHDLHEDGEACLRGYRALVTGSHPEYMSVEMEQTIRSFLAEGGSLAYLGGNGFAGTVAFRDDLMELRRSPLEAGRTWDGPVGEQALSITNEPGGYLRSRGSGEFSLVGGAISLMGFEGSRPFTRTAESYAPEYAWLFDGVEKDTFGEEGIVLGGAAGYEVDATDPHLGTSPDVVVIARADGFPDSFYHDPGRWYAGGDAELEKRRCAEMTLRRLASGGLIFSASSVAWCGALPFPGAMNEVGRIVLNLLGRLSGQKQADGAQDSNL